MDRNGLALSCLDKMIEVTVGTAYHVTDVAGFTVESSFMHGVSVRRLDGVVAFLAMGVHCARLFQGFVRNTVSVHLPL